MFHYKNYIVLYVFLPMFDGVNDLTEDLKQKITFKTF